MDVKTFKKELKNVKTFYASSPDGERKQKWYAFDDNLCIKKTVLHRLLSRCPGFTMTFVFVDRQNPFGRIYDHNNRPRDFDPFDRLRDCEGGVMTLRAEKGKARIDLYLVQESCLHIYNK